MGLKVAERVDALPMCVCAYGSSAALEQGRARNELAPEVIRSLLTRFNGCWLRSALLLMGAFTHRVLVAVVWLVRGRVRALFTAGC